MKQTTKKELNSIVRNIQTGKFSHSDIRSLLIILRSKDKKGSALRDVGDFAAHEDERNQGALHQETSAFIDRFTGWLDSGGTVQMSGPPYTQKELISKMIKALKTEGISVVNDGRFKAQSFEIMQSVLRIISDTKIVILNSNIEACYMSKLEDLDDNKKVVYLCFSIKDNSNHLLKAGLFRTVALVAEPTTN